MLYAAFRKQRDEYARQVNREGKIKLAVVALDGLHIATHKSSSQVRGCS